MAVTSPKSVTSPVAAGAPPKVAMLAEGSPVAEDLTHYMVLDGVAYDTRRMRDRHPGGNLALHYAGGRDLSRTWAALHAFGSPKKLRGWLKTMRVDDAALTRRVVDHAVREPYTEGEGAEACLRRCEAEEAAWVAGAAMPAPVDFESDLATEARLYFRKLACSVCDGSLSDATKASWARAAWMCAVTAGFGWSFYDWAVVCSWRSLLTMPALGQLVAFNVMHDASHCSLSRRPWVNVLGGYLGVAWTSPHEWMLQHVLAHHLQPNVLGEDPDVVHIERYRGVATSNVVALMLTVWAVALPIGLTLLAPLRLLLDGKYPASTAKDNWQDRSKSRSALHLLGRCTHLYAFFFWPFSFMSPLKALFWVALPQVLGSAIFMVVTQVAHLVEATFDMDVDPNEKTSWHKRQLSTSSNYAMASTAHSLLTGGLNHQVEHHLFPTVNHCHLSGLSTVVRRVCSKHDVPYHAAESLTAGVQAHLGLLRSLSVDDAKKLAADSPAAMTPASCPSRVYRGKVWHRREALDGEPQHHFELEGHSMWLLDLDDDRTIGAEVSKFPLRFEPRDHLRSLREGMGAAEPETAHALACAVRALVSERLGVDAAGLGRVKLLTMPRAMGYTFNPISVYYVYGAAEALAAVVFEVSNTPWKDEVLYVHKATADGKYANDKKMHVSPFQPMNQRYVYDAPPPRENAARIVITVSRGGVDYFEAGFAAKGFAPSRADEYLRLAPQRTIFAIFAHAAALLVKGGRFYPHPSGKKTALSRAVEVVFHSRFWLALLFLAPFLPCARLCKAAAYAAVVRRFVVVMAAPSKKASSDAPAVSSAASASAPMSMTPGAAGARPGAAPAGTRASAFTTGSSTDGAVAAVKRVAVIGSGVAGNGAALELTQRGYEVDVFEASSHFGGHARTVTVKAADGVSDIHVDVGFQVFNTSNYPLLTKMFLDLEVDHVQSEMSLSVSSKDSEWSSASPLCGAKVSVGAFVRRVRLLLGVLKFEKSCAAFLETKPAPDSAAGKETIGAFLRRHGFSDAVRDEFVAPMVGALWSVSPGNALESFPMLGVAEFMENHFMLGRARPKWRTPALRSRDYVDKLVRRVGAEKYHASNAVDKLVRAADGRWTVVSACKSATSFDSVVFACPAAAAKRIVEKSFASPPPAVTAVLGRFKTTSSDVCVHRDVAQMPRDRGAWAAWNALQGGTVTYWANVLQPQLGDETPTFITLNAKQPITTEILWRENLSHPLLDSDAAVGRTFVAGIQGTESLFFCGAWCGFGFHEDGLRSAQLAVAALCGEAVPARHVAPKVAGIGRFSKLALDMVARALRAVAPAEGKGFQASVVFSLPDGADVVAISAGRAAPRIALDVLKPAAVWRLLAEPSMGLAEAYCEGELELRPSIRAVLATAIRLTRKDESSSPAQHALGPLVLYAASKFKDTCLHALQRNTRVGSLANIEAHYDISNIFYQLWLDATMTYSSAIYPDATEAAYLAGGELERLQTLDDARDDVLLTAQFRKLDSLIDMAGVRDGDRVLEIGCGWGSLALRTASRFPNVQYVAITISQQQLLEAQERIAAAPADVAARVSIVLCDYRDVVELHGTFDRVMSCEMIEAVGHEFLPAYFGAIGAALKPGGRASVQAITVPDARYESYIRGSDFIRKHIFPGSNLVCTRAVRQALPATLYLDEPNILSIGVSYARTLAAWRVRFEEQLAAVYALGKFDAAFVRKWRYYLEYCEAGFATKHIDVVQLRLFKSDETLAGGGAQDGSVHGGAPRTPLDRALLGARGALNKLFEKGYVPDCVTRVGIRALSAQQLRHCDDAGRRAHPDGDGGLAGAQAALVKTIAALRASPVAVCTHEANEQHYEVDSRFYGLCLGPRRKYSACLFTDATWTPGARRDAAQRLPAAEDAAFEQVVLRAKIDQATKSILDIGCGWGSASLYLAQKFPGAKVVGVSNSNSQREYIMGQAAARGLTNVQIVTLDISLLPLDGALEALHSLSGDAGCAGFERAVSIEMFEHMKNYDALFAKISGVLAPNATLFVHVFCHRLHTYHFLVKSDADWMAKYFFAGGTMPSADLFLYFAAQPGSKFALLDHWRNSGNHYALTSEAWLQNMDANEAQVRAVFAECYPAGDVELWWNRWRAFFLACGELFGYADGQEWCISHYCFQKRELPPPGL